jgi:hypothetical protein
MDSSPCSARRNWWLRKAKEEKLKKWKRIVSLILQKETDNFEKTNKNEGDQTIKEG